MRATKELLLKLQELDSEIDSIKAEQEAIPDKRLELEQVLEDARQRLEKAKQESIDLAKRRKDLEIELEATDEKSMRFKTQLSQVKTNREYEALQHEIAALEQHKSALEDEILEALERSEALAARIKEEEANLNKETERVKQEEAVLDARSRELDDLLAIKQDERVRLVSNLDAIILKRYERIRASKGGTAVTTVVNGACGGCFRRIPPHEMQNLKRDDRLISCEGCGRIIIWRPE